MKKFILFSLFALGSTISFAQTKSVSITIDDVPNIRLYEADGYKSVLLRKLDSLRIPIAIFINEVNLFQSGNSERNKALLKSWIDKDYMTVGNHSYSHQNYAEVGFDVFSEDVIKGETITKSILKGSGKSLTYFRFPFNSLGKDSTQYSRIEKFLAQKNYISTPFTVEGEDWLYTQLYEKAIDDANLDRAKEIGEQYVKSTLRLFDYFDSLSIANDGHAVKQIYLCHDNRLNTDHLPILIQALKQKKYQFVSLDEALKDPLYQSKDYYIGKAGFSWLYRWMADPKKRMAAMRAEPANAEIHKAYEEMNKLK